jgi:hypothetical protein
MASATPERWGRRPVGLVVGVGGGQQALAQVGLALVVLLDHHQLLARHLMVPPVAYSRPIIRPVCVCLP